VQTSGTNFVSQTARVTIQNFTRNIPGVGVTTSGNEFVQQDFMLRTADSKGSTTRPGPPEAVFVQEVPDAARKLYVEAVEKIDKNRINDGLTGLKKAIEVFPSYYAALDRLGTEYVKGQQYEPVIPILSRAVEVNPRGHSSWYALGVAQYNLKQHSVAIESLRRCVTFNPGSVNSQLWLGIALRQVSKLDEAEIHLKKANELAKSKLPDAHWQLALLYNQLKRYGEASDELEQFLKVEPLARDAELITKLIKKLRNHEGSRSKP
jgi:tetratricopeptide (TPR) repeat protein